MSCSGQRAGVQYSSSSGGGGGFSPVAYSKPEINAGEGVVLLQLSQSLSESQHNMMNKFCKMMKIFV